MERALPSLQSLRLCSEGTESPFSSGLVFLRSPVSYLLPMSSFQPLPTTRLLRCGCCKYLKWDSWVSAYIQMHETLST